MRSRGVHRTSFRASIRSSGAVAAALALAALAVAPASASVGRAGDTRSAGRAGAGAAHTDVVVLYNFEQAAGGIVDESGNGHVLRRATSSGGTTRIVTHDTGRAVAFPDRCNDKRCPRAVLQVPDAADLNPGTAPFVFGATILLGRRQTTDGQNVVQKGYSATGSQYKLQIDGAAGRPSCVLVDRRDPTIRLAKSNRTVADGAWHRIACHRSRTQLSIVVDGVLRGAAPVPATLSVTNDRPLSIGGKGAFRDNDQFQGALDDVWVSVG